MIGGCSRFWPDPQQLQNGFSAERSGRRCSRSDIRGRQSWTALRSGPDGRRAFRDRILRAISNIRANDYAEHQPSRWRSTVAIPPVRGSHKGAACVGVRRDWLVAARRRGWAPRGRRAISRPAVVGRRGGLGCLGGYSERPARIGFLFVGYRAGGTDRRRQTRFVVAGGRTRIRPSTGGGASTAATSAHVNPGAVTRVLRTAKRTRCR